MSLKYQNMYLCIRASQNFAGYITSTLEDNFSEVQNLHLWVQDSSAAKMARDKLGENVKQLQVSFNILSFIFFCKLQVHELFSRLMKWDNFQCNSNELAYSALQIYC